VDPRHFLLGPQTGIGSVWRWVDTDDYRPPALLGPRKAPSRRANEARSVAGSYTMSGAGGCRLLPPGCVFWRSGYQALTGQANNSGDVVDSIHCLISATRGLRTLIVESCRSPPVRGGAPNHDMVALRELTDGFQSRDSNSPRSIRRRKLFPLFPPPLVGFGKLQS
jgi:hypothetical protein